MQIAYREIVSILNRQILINLPENITAGKVEVIIIPIYSPEPTKPDFNKYFGISNIGTSAIDSILNRMRDEWDREIFD